MRKVLRLWGGLLLLVILVSIGQSLLEAPDHQCDACGELMKETERVIGDGWERVEFRCDCGKRGTRALRENGRSNWWEWDG